MRFSPSFLDDIRARLPISEIVGARVRFDPKKSNAARGDYWGCCPFHGEKTPSFHCDDRRGIYHCFGCGVSGDIFRFLTELDGLSFYETVERLAAKAGLSLPKLDPQAEKLALARANLYDVLEAAARFYEKNLQQGESAEAAAARAYLRERGVSLATQKQFRLGYAPSNARTLKGVLQRQLPDPALLEQAGLFITPEDGGASYDRFRDRIIFPITDIKERVIAFGGRALNPQARAKYLNSPETELFHKGRLVYNLAQARQAMRGINGAADKPLIVVEGYMDVTALAQGGFGQAVAPLGTALTEEQLHLLWRYCPQPVLCFDGDKAGLQAAYRALDRALPLLKTGASLQFALLPEGQDPDDILRAEGSGRFAALLAEAAPLSTLLWQRATAEQSFTTPESRAALEKRLRAAALTIQDSGLRHYYLQDIKQRLWNFFRSASPAKRSVSAGGGRGAFGRAAQGGFYAAAGFDGSLITKSLSDSSFVRAGAAGGKGGAYAPRDAVILALLAAQPVLWHENFDVLAQLDFPDRDLQALCNAMLEVLGEAAAAGGAAAFDGNSSDPPEAAAADMRARLEQKGQKAVLDKITAFTANLGIKTDAESLSAAQARAVLGQALTLYRRAHSLHKQISEIEADLRNNATGRDFARLAHLREELRRSDALDAAPDDASA